MHTWGSLGPALRGAAQRDLNSVVIRNLLSFRLVRPWDREFDGRHHSDINNPDVGADVVGLGLPAVDTSPVTINSMRVPLLGWPQA